MRFDEGGRIDLPFGVLVQRVEQDGDLVPCTFLPVDYANCDAKWRPAGHGQEAKLPYR